MGNHGQTLNGDHGGGSTEEVETSVFAMSFKQPPFSIPFELYSSSCEQDLGGKKMSISSIQQLDFAVTVLALLGVSFPFGRCRYMEFGGYQTAELQRSFRSGRMGTKLCERTLHQFLADCKFLVEAFLFPLLIHLILRSLLLPYTHAACFPIIIFWKKEMCTFSVGHNWHCQVTIFSHEKEDAI